MLNYTIEYDKQAVKGIIDSLSDKQILKIEKRMVGKVLAEVKKQARVNFRERLNRGSGNALKSIKYKIFKIGAAGQIHFVKKTAYYTLFQELGTDERKPRRKNNLTFMLKTGDYISKKTLSPITGKFFLKDAYEKITKDSSLTNYIASEIFAKEIQRLIDKGAIGGL